MFEVLLGHGTTLSATRRDVRSRGGYQSPLLRMRGGVLGQLKDTGDTRRKERVSKTGTRCLTSPSSTPPSGQGKDSGWQAASLSPSFLTAATLDCSEKQVETNAEGTRMCP